MLDKGGESYLDHFVIIVSVEDQFSLLMRKPNKIKREVVRLVDTFAVVFG